MAFTTLCAVVAALRVLPDRSQFFLYESVSLSCESQGNASDWTVKRNTSRYKNQTCPTSSDRPDGCVIGDLYLLDSGAYWCESAAGECSNTVSITVTDGPVILESPALPVTEGDAVTLSCRTKTTSSTSSTTSRSADFYKDGVLIGSSATGNLTIRSVSRSDEGLYRCDVSAAGASPESRLTVTAGRAERPDSPLAQVLLPVVGVGLALVVVMLLRLWRKHKGDLDSDVSYTDVIVTRGLRPDRTRDADAARTFYSAVKPENS